MAYKLYKYHGLGNDYLVWNPIRNQKELTEEMVQCICNRHYGAGADGILEGPFAENGMISVKIWNPDGSEAEAGGNGIRIFAKYLKDYGYVQKKHFQMWTKAGEVEISYLNERGSRLRISVGKLSFWSDEITVTGPRREVVGEKMIFHENEYEVTCVTVGNPHCVIPMESVSKDLVCELGQYTENAPYFPQKINTQILRVLDRNNIEIEIYERGAGYTLASGSSSCAAAGAAYRLGLVDNRVYVHMPGGKLLIEIEEDGKTYLTGEVNAIGTFTLAEELENIIMK